MPSAFCIDQIVPGFLVYYLNVSKDSRNFRFPSFHMHLIFKICQTVEATSKNEFFLVQFLADFYNLLLQCGGAGQAR